MTKPLRLLSGDSSRPSAPFDSLPGEVRAALRGIGHERRFGRGESILRQDVASDALFVLVEGRAKLTRDLAAGRTVLLSLFGPGDLFGTVAALAGLPSDASVVTLESCRVLEIEREALLDLLVVEPRLLRALLPALTGHLAECRHCIVELTGARVETRFSTLFLRLADDVGVPRTRGVHVPIRLTRQELADLAATTIETAIRVLSRWHKEEILETRDDGFLLVDRESLERLARGEHSDST